MSRGSLRTDVRTRFVRSLAAAAFALTTSLLCLPRIGGADQAEPAGKSTPNLDFSVLDSEGVVHSLRTNSDRAALVLVFLAPECPIANGSIPELNRQSAALAEAGSRVKFFGVISDCSVTRAAAARHAAEFKIRFPV